MNWRTMNKEQKQKVILGLLLGVFAVAALYQFVLVPMLARQAESAQRRDDLAANVEKARAAIRSEHQLDRQLGAIRDTLGQVFARQLPPSDSPLSWASQAINVQVRQLGLDVISITEGDAMAGVWSHTDLAKRSFRPYAVRLELACSFEDARKLVRSLQQSNPHLAVSGLSIAADTRNVEKLQVMLMLEWPSWRDPKQGVDPFVSKAPPVRKKDGT